MCRKLGNYHERSLACKLCTYRGLPSRADRLESPHRMAVRWEMPVRIVNSKQNARLKELRRALRSPDRAAGGLVGVEGPHLVEEAVRAGLHIEAVFVRMDDKEIAGIRDAEKYGIDEVVFVSPDVFDSAAGTETPQSVAALVEPRGWGWPDVLEPGKTAPLVIVLAGVQDPGNLGTILRSAEAFGAGGAVSLPGTVSCWNQKAMRASAGSVFRLPVIHAGVNDALKRLREGGFRVLTTVAKGGTPAEEVDFSAPTALLIGNEGNGVPEDIAARADGAVTIPCPGPVESLNASVAASVLLYEASRQRRSLPTLAAKTKARRGWGTQHAGDRSGS
jgi:TrmH family RNA methyltransferase